MFRTLRQHPRVVPLFDDQVPLGPRSLAAREAALGTMLASGFPPEGAARAFATVGHYIIGFAGQMAGDSAASGQEIREFFGSLDPARFPATAVAGPHLPSSPEDEFRFGLQLIVDGLAKYLADRQ
jgi:hypothetical protein